jgi:short-subunit dehydrogenase
MDFKDRVVLISGASSGIGRRLAVDLAARGATVVGCARSRERLEETEREMKRYSATSIVHPCDVGDPQQVQAMVEKVLAQFGRIDVLINNAGFGFYKTLADSPLESIEAVLRTNFLGAVYCIKEVLPSMTARRSGHIVNIASGAGKIGTPKMAAYCASKFAMIGLSESLYHEFRPLGIHVSVISPGPVRTKMQLLFDQLAAGVWTPEFLILKTEEVSRAVIRAIEKKRFEAVIPFWLAVVCRVKALCPALFRFLSYHALRLRQAQSIRKDV